MPLVTDGVGNYYIGSEGFGVDHATLVTELGLAFGALGVEHSFSSNYNVAWRPNIVEEILTPSINNTSVNMNTGVGDPLITDGARFQAQIEFGTDSATNNCALGFMNGSAGTTGNALTLRHNGVSGLSNNDIRTNLANAQCWAVCNNRSLVMFQYVDDNNYFFIHQGRLIDSVPSYPFDAETTHILNTGGQYSCFSYRNANFVSPALKQYTDTLCNYNHTPVSGSPGQSWKWVPRNELPGMSSDGDPIGVEHHVIQMDVPHLTGFTISDVTEVNNITLGSNTVDGSSENRFMMVGRLGNVTENDQGGDGLFMRVKKI